MKEVKFPASLVPRPLSEKLRRGLATWAMILWSSTTIPFNILRWQKVKVQTCHCTCAVHMKCLYWWWLLNIYILVNLTSGGSWLLPTCYCPYLPWLCHHGGVASFLEKCILRALLAGWTFCSWYVQIVEPLQSLQAQPTWLSWSSLMNAPPLLPWDDDNRWSQHQRLCWMT